jgi:uncharacterized protein (TIGR03437 family)
VPANPLVITAPGNSYTGRDGPLAPGELATITVTGLQPVQPTDLGYTAPLPTALAGTQVFFDGEPAAIAAVLPGSIYCVTPYDLAGKTSTTIQVKFNGQISTAITADVVPTDIGLLSADGSGAGQAYARNADGTLNSPANPAKAGSQVTFYLTGLGSSGSSCPYGQIDTASFTPQQTLSSILGGPLQVSSLEGFVCGMYSVQVRAPELQAAAPTAEFSVVVSGGAPRAVAQNYGVSQTVTFAVTP